MNALLHGLRQEGGIATMQSLDVPTDEPRHESAIVNGVPCHSKALLVTVVVPTFRRPELLARCLQALAHQDIESDCYEIVVVDDGPDPSTRAVVESFAGSRGAGVGIRYLVVQGGRGPAAARNVGWRAAHADIIAFTDDDTIPMRSWLREGLRAMRGSVAAVAGTISVPIDERPSDYQRNVARLMQAEFATANCFVRRSALQTIGGFDQRFVEAWREDSDLQFMLLSRGAMIARAPRAIVTHPVRPAGLFECLHEQHKIVFDALLYKKHPTLYRLRIRRYPRWDYYCTMVTLLLAFAAAIADEAVPATLAALSWAAFVATLCRKRLAGTSRQPLQVLAVVVTSMAIPPVATYWRLVGAIRFRTFFL